MNTIAVQLTGQGVSAIAVIMLSGDQAAAITARLAASPRARALNIGDAAHAALLQPDTHEKLDDAMIVRTAADTFEFHIHGGRAVIAAVTAALQSAGAQLLSIEEAHARQAFGQGLSADLLLALPRAKTMTAARLLAAQPHEGLAAWSTHWQSWLANKTPNDLWPLHSATQWLLDRSQTLAHLLDPPRIAIIGPPNAGKSTLANALLGRPISITSAIAGTTRDWVDAQATFITGDIQIPVTLIDTAGIRETADALEQESIARTHHQAHAADAIILLFDASHEPTADDRSLLTRYIGRRDPLIIAANKTDLPHPHLPTPNALPLSAKNAIGLDALMTTVLARLDLAQISPTEPFAFTDRQRHLLHQLALTNTPAAAHQLLSDLIR